ncbi:MAG: arginine repressor [Myxococcota bacterium]
MKTRRRHMILRLVETHEVESQDQLQALLSEHGFEVNQATLSRDLRALGVIKQPVAGGGARYRKARPGPDRAVATGNLRAFLREIVPSGNLLVLKTRVGGAQPVGLALDQLQVEGIIGTIAGDDTVLVVLAEDADAKHTMGAIWALMEEARSGT